MENRGVAITRGVHPRRLVDDAARDELARAIERALVGPASRAAKHVERQRQGVSAERARARGRRARGHGILRAGERARRDGECGEDEGRRGRRRRNANANANRTRIDRRETDARDERK